MSKSKTVVTSSGFPFLPVLTLVFIVLKLTGYIAWSWLWVLSPMLIPVSIAALIFILLIIWKRLLQSRKAFKQGWSFA